MGYCWPQGGVDIEQILYIPPQLKIPTDFQIKKRKYGNDILIHTMAQIIIIGK